MTGLIVLAACIVLLVALVAVYAERATRPEDPMITLRRELAEGKISSDEFLERESALRSTMSKRR